MKDNKIYKILRILIYPIVILLFHPKVKGLENIPKRGRILLAGNHTKWKDPVVLVVIVKRQIHFLAKQELFHGLTKVVMKAMGCIPVNRKIHDKDCLIKGNECLNNDLCVGIFPEGTVNKTDSIVLPFKKGAVKMSLDTNSKIVPFIITGKYKTFGKSVEIEFLKPIELKKDIEYENNRLMEIISKRLKEKQDEKNGRL